jgi:hypothetical protein
MKKTYQGSCHCGAVRFECDLDLAAGTTRCNCRFCSKARFWFALVKQTDFRILQGDDVLTDYQRPPPGKPAFLHFCFCSRCGVRGFTRSGEMPAPGDTFCAVNLGCLDNATDEELATARIHYADGRHDDWKREPAEHRHL